MEKIFNKYKLINHGWMIQFNFGALKQNFWWFFLELNLGVLKELKYTKYGRMSLTQPQNKVIEYIFLPLPCFPKNFLARSDNELMHMD